MASHARALLREALDRKGKNVAEVALLIAKERYPEVVVSDYLEILRKMGEGVAAHAGEPGENIEALNNLLFQVEGFLGAQEEYYSPENSFLNRVIDRRKGIPITLSIIYMEVGRNAGLEIEGVGLPGHFVVRYDYDGGSTLIDPFSQGRILTGEDCRKIVDEMYTGQLQFRREFLRAWTKEEILVRMMNNLKGIYLRQGDYGAVSWALDIISAINPDNRSQARDRAYVLFAMGRYWEAKELFEEYLRLEPDAEDAEEVRGIIQNIRRLLATLA